MLSFLTLLPSIFLSGFIYPLAALPKVLQVLSGIIPLSYFLIVVRGIVIKGVGTPALMPQIIALAIFGTVLIVLGGHTVPQTTRLMLSSAGLQGPSAPPDFLVYGCGGCAAPTPPP